MSFEDFKKEVINDYTIAVISRECSLLGRREVLTGKAKFGIFGDGKEIPQIAWAKAFMKGDFRSGYYRDQTFMMALGELSIEQFFAGLYAHTDINADPMSAGRQMGGHFASHNLDDQFQWKDLTKQYNSSADISPTAGQMARLLGLAQASKIYRQLDIQDSAHFSTNGNEVAWGTIGNASTSEGVFFETINAAVVLQVPMIVSVWDDEYGISVPAKYQTAKEDITAILKGFEKTEQADGMVMFRVKAWDYPRLIEVYQEAGAMARRDHVPVFIHVDEVTQPQGHSTSGSHERYKSPERLTWEREHDCIFKMREWMIANDIIDEEALSELDKSLKRKVREGKKKAWAAFIDPIIAEQKELIGILTELAQTSVNGAFIKPIIKELESVDEPSRKFVLSRGRKALRYVLNDDSVHKDLLVRWVNTCFEIHQPKFSSLLYSESKFNPCSIEAVAPEYDENSKWVDGRIVLRDNFEALFDRHANTLVFGEDSGKIGDVNQGLEGLQGKFGELRVTDTGIREATIVGQGIGMAMRGLRPIAEIQYLDYLMYGLQVLSDDLATLHYRSFGKQKAPLIVRTRGHRLEGIWHSGSQLGGILNLIRGIYVLVPRNMTQAAGFYNTLIEGDQPALVVECLNGYRLKEQLPTNIGAFKTPIGKVDVLKTGGDITVVSYGSTLRLVEKAASELLEVNIDVEVIDAQSLIPFDLEHGVLESVKKTNRLMIIDEDVPGGASAYLLDHILNTQQAFNYLDSPPQTLTAKEHRPAYGTDGDYFSKPSKEDIFEALYNMMRESNPEAFPPIR